MPAISPGDERDQPGALSVEFIVPGDESVTFIAREDHRDLMGRPLVAFIFPRDDGPPARPETGRDVPGRFGGRAGDLTP